MECLLKNSSRLVELALVLMLELPTFTLAVRIKPTWLLLVITAPGKPQDRISGISGPHYGDRSSLD
jgi:hypothetical protein